MRPRGTGCIYLRGKTYWVKYFRKGKEYFESSHSERESDAQKLLNKRLGDIETGRFRGLTPERVTIGALCKLVTDDYEFRKLRSLKDVEYRLKNHIKPALGLLPASKFGTSQLKAYVSARRGEGAEDATINRELAVIRRGYKLAAQNDPPLVARAPHIPAMREDNARQGFIEHEAYTALLDHMPRHLKAMFVCGYYLGMRQGELRKIKWNQLDLAASQIRLSGRQTKNKSPRTAPIYGDMAKWLQWQRDVIRAEFPACELVFHWNGRPISAHLPGWIDACKEAGHAGLLFHDLRRSAVRNMERAGFSRKVAMSISGHKTESIYRRYDIVDESDLKAAAEKMEAYVAGKTAKPQERQKLRRVK